MVRTFATDLSNASRTLLLDLDRGEWADELLDIFGIPRRALPRSRPSRPSAPRCSLRGRDGRGAHVGCRRRFPRGACRPPRTPGGVQPRRSFGTGTSVMAPIESATASRRFRRPSPGLAGGHAGRDGVRHRRQHLRHRLGAGMDCHAAGPRWDVCSFSKRLARSCGTSGGVCFVPALSGLGAPYWDPAARGPDHPA